ncbi:SCY1-like protein 2 [Boothiomyces sp. JEL0838]|nr:SCY1-like protein 2 [Boothiomyces sp. JEL0838]
MGNALSQQYEIKQSITKSGPGDLWNISSATKKQTGKQLSIFMFDKSRIQKLIPFAKPEQLKKETEYISEIMKQSVQQLTRLRHPCILHVTEAFVDLKTMFCFGSDPLIGNLSSLIHTNPMDELEIQAGLLNICKGLEFLHSNGIIHNCLTPSSIFIDVKNDWKISGFEFASRVGTLSIRTFPQYCLPSLAYFAPEVILNDQCEPKSDVYSLGALVCALFNKGHPHCIATMQNFKDAIAQPLNLSFLPAFLESVVRQMLAVEITMRIDLDEFLQTDYFNSNTVNTIKYLGTFIEQSNSDKAAFLKGLLGMLPLFSTLTLVKKILPVLEQEMKNPALINFLLPNILFIAEKTNETDFKEHILPCIKISLSSQNNDIILAIYSKIDLILQKCDIKELIPFIMDAIQSTDMQIQTTACQSLSKIAPNLDYHTIKNIYDKTQQIFSTAKVVGVQGNTLLAIKSLVPKLDSKSSELVDYQIIGTIIIPQLWVLSFHQQITMQNFKNITSTIDNLSTLARQQKLKQIEQNKPVEQSKPVQPINPIVREQKETPASLDFWNRIDNMTDQKPLSSFNKPATLIPPSRPPNYSDTLALQSMTINPPPSRPTNYPDTLGLQSLPVMQPSINPTIPTIKSNIRGKLSKKEIREFDLL